MGQREARRDVRQLRAAGAQGHDAGRVVLRRGLAVVPEQAEPAGDEDEEQASTSLHTRALPLLELLQAAIADETRVRWE